MLDFYTYAYNTMPADFPPKLYLRIGMLADGGRGDRGERLITPEMRCVSEVDEYINRIISALERVRREAKAKLEENQ